MRIIDPNTVDRLSRQGASLCHCWRLTRKDGQELGLTDHNQDLTFSGTIFRKAHGADGSALENTVSLSPDNADFLGILSEENLGKNAIEAGRYDEAHIEIWKVDWEDANHRMLLKTGRLGEIERSGLGYRVEFHSVKALLDIPAGRIYGRLCDASLGDDRCKIVLSTASNSITGTVLTANQRDFTLALNASVNDGDFTQGQLAIDSGPLSGVRRSIRLHTNNNNQQKIHLWSAFPQRIDTNTAITVIAGCDKSFATCRDRFANQLNFRGFPHIPGSDVLTLYPQPADA